MLFVLEAIFLFILLSSMEESDTSIIIEHVKKTSADNFYQDNLFNYEHLIYTIIYSNSY